MKKKKIIIISAIILVLLIGVILYFMLKKDYIEYTENENFVFLNNKYEIEYDLNEGKVFKDYTEFMNVFNSDKLNESDFEKYNYVFIPISYIECAEENVKPVNYEIKDNVIKIKVKYEKKCGLCAPNTLYYLLKVNKDIENVTVEFDYEQTNNIYCGFNDVEYKPIIYLYPKERTEVTVKLLNSNFITTSYPKYNNEWKVTAYPNGTLIDPNNKEYYGLYWEGNNHHSEIKEDGFVIKGEDTIEFLEEKLSLLGLNSKERNEFIIYWLKYLENNKYNYIRFETEEEINSYMPLEVNPKPDTIIRVWMTYKPLNEHINVKDQVLNKVDRKGYVLVEWGGSEI